MNFNNNEVRKAINQASLDELHMLMQRFPRVITGMNALESEFLEYQATTDDIFSAYFEEDDNPMHIDHMRHQLSKQIDLYSGQPHFKHLAEFAKILLLIPHDNSYCESIFSTIRKICTDGCHNLGKDATQGHASTSVYTETTSIRNNLLGILILRITILGKKKLACYKWEPQSLSLLKQNLQHTKTFRLGKNSNSK